MVMSQQNGAGLPTIPVLVGPTASGKTALTAHIHDQYPSIEIISADSRQIYTGMDIGTAKVSRAFREAIPHHLIDILTPDVKYSAGKFARDAASAIQEIFQRGNVPLIVGGTGFYIRALFEGLQAPPTDPTVLEMLEKRMDNEGYDQLVLELQRVDPQAAQYHPPENRVKTLRALACYHQTGIPYSHYRQSESVAEFAYRPNVYCLMPDRAELYSRINNRAIAMLDDGLVEETQKLIALGYSPESPGLRTVGYKEVLAYMAGDCTRDEMVAGIQQSTRRYAKRQMTWFRRQLKEAQYSSTFDGWQDWFEGVIKNRNREG